MADLVSIGFKADATGIEQVNKSFDKVVASGSRADATIRSAGKSADKLGNATSKSSDKMAMFGRQSGQAGIQLQQFIGQVQGGQSAMLALSQQSADLGIVLGAPLVGAIVGISSSLVGLLIPNLLKADDATDRLEKAMKLLDKTAKDNNGVFEYSKQIRELAQQSEKAAKLLVLAAEQQAKNAGRAAADAIGEEFNKAFDVSFFDANFEALKNIAGTAEATGFTISKAYEALGKQFGLTGKDARQAGIDILVSMREMELAISTAAPNSSAKITQFNEKLADLANSASGTNKTKLLNFVAGITEYLEKAGSAAKISENFKKVLKDIGNSLQTDKQKEFADSVNEISKSLGIQVIALRDGEEAALKHEIAQKLNLKTIEEIPAALKETIAEYFKLQAAKKQLTKDESEEEKQLKRSMELLNRNVSALEDQRQKLLLTADAYDIYRIKQDAAINGYDPAPLLEQVKTLKLLRDEIAFQEFMDAEFIAAFDEGEKTLADFALVSEKAAERIESAFADVWLNMFDGFKSVVSGIKDAFKRLLAEMAHISITKPILISLGLGGALPANASGLSGAAGLLGAGGGAFGAGVGGTMSLLGAGSVSGAFSNIGSLFAGGEFAAGIGAALPIAAIAAASAGIVDKLTGGKLFGSSFKETGRDLNLGIGAGGFTGSTLTTEQKERSLFRGTKTRTSRESIDSADLNAIFDSLKMSIGLAASTFNFGDSATEFLDGFNNSLKVSIKGKSKEEVEQIITDWVSQTSGKMVKGALGSFVDDLAIAGEDLSTTLNRLVANMNAVSFVTKSIQLSFDLTGEAAARASTNIVNLSGGLDAFTSASQSYIDRFFTDAEKTEILGDSLSSAFTELGVQMPLTVQGFRDLIEPIDLTTESGQALFASLISLNPAMADYIDMLDKQSDAIKELEKAGIESALNDLEKAIDAEKDRVELILDGAKDIYKAEIERISGIRDTLKDAFNELTKNLDDAKSAMTSAFDAQKQSIIDASKIRIDGIRQEIDASREYHQAELDFINNQKSAVSDMISGLSGASGNLRGLADVDTTALSNDLAKALSAARVGNFNPAMQLGDVSALRGDASQFESAAQMRVSQGVTGFRANELANLVDNQLTIEERTLAALEKQLIDEGLRFDEEQSTLNDRIAKEQEFAEAQIKALDAQLNSLLGINDGVMSVDASIIAFQKAQDELNSLDYERQLEILAEQEEWAMDALDQAEQSAIDQQKTLDSILNDGRNQINALYNVNSSVLSVVDAIKQLQITVQNAENAQAARDLQIAKQTRKSADSLQQIVIDGVQTEAIA